MIRRRSASAPLVLRFEVNPAECLYRGWDERRFSLVADMAETSRLVLGLEHPADLLSVRPGRTSAVLTFGVLTPGAVEPPVPTAAELLTLSPRKDN